MNKTLLSLNTQLTSLKKSQVAIINAAIVMKLTEEQRSALVQEGLVILLRLELCHNKVRGRIGMDKNGWD